MIASASMSTTTATLTSQPEVVADRVLRRAELGKMAQRLQSRLALAHFKTRHGWEDLTFDMIEPKFEDEMRRKRTSDGVDVLSDSSSSASDQQLPYPSTRGGSGGGGSAGMGFGGMGLVASSPLKAPLFSDAVGSSNGSTGHRKRTYVALYGDDVAQPRYVMSSPSKRYRSSPPLMPPPSHTHGGSRHVSNGPGPVPSNGFSHRSSYEYLATAAGGGLAHAHAHAQPPAFSGHAAWKDHHHLSHSSPIKPRRQQHFTTAAGPDVSLFPGARRIADALTASASSSTMPNYHASAQSDDDDELLPTHSFQVNGSMSLGPPATTLTSSATAPAVRAGSPPSTPPMRARGSLPGRRKKKAAAGGGGGGGDNGVTSNPTGLGIDQVDANDDHERNGHHGDAGDGVDGSADAGAGGGGGGGGGKSGVEGADLLLFLAASPSPAQPSGRNGNHGLLGSSSRIMEPPSTPPSKFNSMALPSSMMTTPGGGSLFPNTPGQAFDFADFVNITPSPAQKPWKTPNLLGGSKTPLSITRRRLTFDDPL